MLTTRTIGAAALILCAGLSSTANADRFQRVLGTPDREMAYSIENTSDGGYITAGFRDDGPAASPNEDVLVTKHFADGTVEWQRRWAGPGRDIGYAVQETIDGGFIVAAESESSGDPLVETLLIKLDSNGNLLWNNFYFGTFQGDPIHDVHPGVAIDQGFNGQIYMTGNVEGRAMILAVDMLGNVIWNATYADPITDPDLAARFAFTDIKHDPTTSSLVVSGTTLREEVDPITGAFHLAQDAFLVRLSGSGAPIWIWNYDFQFDLDPADEVAVNSRETGDGLDISPTGRIILNGRTDFGGPGVEPGTHLVAVDPGGWPTWSREYTYSSPDGIVASVRTAYAAVRFDDDMNIVQAGRNESFGGVTRALESLTAWGGAPIWMYEYGGSNGRGESVAVHPDCGYAMAGQLDMPALPFVRGEKYVVKNDDDGRTGCAEIPWGVGPDFVAQTKQNGIVPDYIDKIMTAPDLLVDTIPDDTALCYDADCGDDPCICDLNADGIVDLADVSAFITCFTGSLPCGDLAPAFGVWDIADIGAFIDCFIAGCD